MPSDQDSAGRPIVVVTGMGVVTSLGAGKAENWKNLTAGKSGIKNITRFATDGLKTRFAGTVDFVPAEPLSAPELSERLADLAAEEAIAESGIGSRGDFPGPLFSRCRRSRSNGRSAARSRRPPAPTPMSATTTSSAPRASRQVQAVSTSASCSARSPTIWPTSSAPRARRSRCRPPAPRARPRSSSASRRSAAARPSAALCIGSDGSVNPESLIRFSLLSALSTSNDPPRAGGQALRQEPRRLRHGRGRRRAGAGKPGIRQGARREDPRRHRTAAARWPTPSTARARARTASRSSAASAMRWPTPASTPDDIDYVNPHGTGTPENDKMEAMGVMAVFGERAKTLPMSSNKSMVGHTLSAAGAVEAVFSLLTLAAPAHPADHQLPGAGSGDPDGRGAERGARRQGAPRHLQFVRLRRPERLAGDGARTGVTRHHPRAARCSATASSNWPRSLPRRRPRPARCRSRSRRSRSTISTSGAFAAWPSPSARCRSWSAPRPRARSPRSATA